MDDGILAVSDRQLAWAAMRTLVLDGTDGRARVAEALGMSFLRARALRYLARQPQRLRDLAIELCVDPPYTTLIIDDLERRGLVVRRTDPTDKRCKLASVTPLGQNLADQADVILSTPPATLNALSDADLADLNRILTKLVSS